LLFVSFSCPVCNQLLRQLRKSPKDLRNRLVLFMLDTDIERRYANVIHKMGLQSFPIVEAYDLAQQFRIYRAPFVYVVDGQATITEALAVVSTNDLVALARRHFGAATSKEERTHASRTDSPGPPGRAGGPAGGPGVAAAHAP